MTPDTLIMFFGAFVALLPFLGFPNSWDTVFLLIAGVCIVALGIVIRRGGVRASFKRKETHSVASVTPQDVHRDAEEETIAQ